ncbi:MAG: hypothetical protein NDJ90_07620 [Oligoflexia bacterium]|nr:hypothetical protein [Oligoflexia bacterium]
MEPLYLHSEKALYAYLKKFFKAHPKAVQLDGATQATPNRQVIAVFRYSLDGQKYKILGELTREAALEYISLTDEHGDPAVVLKEYNGKEGGLILAHSMRPNGWACLPYVNKSTDRFKKAA